MQLSPTLESAKFAKGLIFKIIQHALDEGFLNAGETVLDCFGGVGLGGLPCALQGIRHVAVELEPRFCALANGFDCGGDVDKHEACAETGEHGPHHITGNLELWQRRYGSLPQWVAPRMLQGDSRALRTVLEAADCCMSSPPYVQSLHNKFDVQDRAMRERKAGKRLGGGQITHDRDYGSSPDNLGNLPPGSVDACLSSPPHCHGLGKEHTYADHAKRDKDSHRGIMREKGIADPFYGDNPAQLGNMPAGTLDACVASPPFSGTEQPCASQSRGLKDYHAFTRGQGTKRDATHTGETPGQLSAMATGEVTAVVASPPWDEGNPPLTPERQRVSSSPKDHGGPGPQYQAMATLGSPDTFWSAARTILEQVYALLRPGGVAIWVVKSYIRDKAIVDFPHQWERLCHAVGFITLHEHHALLVDSHSEMGLFGEEVEMYRKSSKSFFRRLAEKAGAPEINHETVFCMQKPDMREVHMEGWEDLPPWMQAYFGSKEDFEAIGPLRGSEAWRQLPLCDACCSSPPYVQSVHDGNGIDPSKLTGNRPAYVCQAGAEGYGRTDGQLGAMSPGELTAVISSPPYAGAGEALGQHNGIDWSKTQGTGQCLTPGRAMQPYGTTEGNLGSMPTGEPLGGEAGK